MPSSVKKRRNPSGHLDRIIANGLQFIERGVKELWSKNDKHHLKHSVINFYSGVELLLKARLMMEHWALIVSDIKAADAEKFLGGKFRSVGLDETVTRLKKIAGVDISVSATSAFHALQTHRNQMVHFYHQTDLRTKEGKNLRSQVINEQCVGWFYLRRLIGESWSEEFQAYQGTIETINGMMKPHHAYLETVYTKITPELQKEAKNGADLGHCYSCGFDAHVITEIGPSESRCRVCTNFYAFLRHKCEHCSHLFLGEDGVENVCCPNCKSVDGLTEIMDVYTEEGQMGQEDFLIDGGYGNCSECEGYHTVGTIEDRSFCFQCHLFQSPMGVCEWCNEKATGDLEGSYYSGCVMCDGKAGWDGD